MGILGSTAKRPTCYRSLWNDRAVRFSPEPISPSSHLYGYGNVGLRSRRLRGHRLTCAEVTGTIYSGQCQRVLCLPESHTRALTTAKTDLTLRINDAAGRTGGLL